MPKRRYQKQKMNKTGAKLTVFLVLFLSIGIKANAFTCEFLKPDTTKARVDAKGRAFPIPPPNPDRLFFLQRSPNINALSYDININAKTGVLNEDEPVHVYWLRYAEGHGEPSELTFVQRQFAYGVNATKNANGSYDIRIMSYKKFPLTLMKGADRKYHIFATISKKQAVLRNIFIQIDGGTLWAPNVMYIEVKGVDPVTGKEVTERFKP